MARAVLADPPKLAAAVETEGVQAQDTLRMLVRFGPFDLELTTTNIGCFSAEKLREQIMGARLLSVIAAEIRADWVKIDSAAAPYVKAMGQLSTLKDDYGNDSAIETVTRFLSVANSWRGETARRVKAELGAMLKDKIEQSP
jgi:hypothetical protein